MRKVCLFLEHIAERRAEALHYQQTTLRRRCNVFLALVGMAQFRAVCTCQIAAC
jgi:hypothetical protein